MADIVIDDSSRTQREDFMQAIKDGNLEKVKATVEKFPRACEWTTENGYTAVHRAIYAQQPLILDYLVEKGANINRRGLHGTPLIYAVFCGQDDAAKWLLAQGADASLINPLGETALTIAVLRFNAEMIPVLLTAAPEVVNLPDSKGNTPLARAGERGNLKAARVLMQHGARFDTRNKAGETPADLAARKGHPGLAGIISEHVADLAHKATHLENPLKPMKPLSFGKK